MPQSSASANILFKLVNDEEPTILIYIDLDYIQAERLTYDPVTRRAMSPQADNLTMDFYKSEPQFPFLELPGELRNEIYGILLTNTTAVPSSAYRKHYHRKVPVNISAAILQVSRQIHSEARPLLYKLNRFHAHPTLLNGLPYLADSSRPVTSAANSALIRRYSLAVRLDCDPFWTGEDLARAFSGVDELEVEAWQASFGVCDYSVLFAFTNVRNVGRAKVSGSGLPADFAAWLGNVMQSSELEVFPPRNPVEWNEWTNGNR